MTELPNSESKILQAIKLNWIKKLHDTNYQALWTLYISQFFNTDIHIIAKSNLSGKHLPEFKEKFYVEIWKICVHLNYKELEKVEDVLRQRLCNNSLVTIARRPIVNNSGINQKFIKIKDIIMEEGKIL